VTPVVSIVIPTFNRSRLVSRAIDSSLAQTVPVEVVVCDHGSTDDTPAVAAAYGTSIRYVRREQDQGPFVEKTLPLLRAEVGFVYTRTRIHEPGNPQTKVLLRHPAGTRPVSQIVQFLLREKLPISPGCALFRKRDALKNLLLEVPGAEGRYGKNSGVGEDLLLFLLATLDYPRYAHVPEALSHFLAHPASITTHAGSSGRMDALAKAYQLAKDHYLRQPASLPLARGLAGRLARARWQFAGHLHG